MLETRHLLVESDTRGVCTLILNRPGQHNALDAALIRTLHARLRELETDDGVRVVILTGTGSTFCSGVDLVEMQARTLADDKRNRHYAERFSDLLHCLNTLSKPTIARIDGAAYGGGIGLIACCDIVVATVHAEFAFSEVKLGLYPAVISPYVIEAIGRRQARRYFLTGQAIDTARALDMGLIHQTVEAEGLDAAIAEQVAYLLKAGPRAQAECKRGLAPGIPADQRFTTAERLTRVSRSSEAREGLAAFLHKRVPSWRA